MKRITVIAVLILLFFVAVCALVSNSSDRGASLIASDLTLQQKQVEWQKMKKRQSILGQQAEDVFSENLNKPVVLSKHIDSLAEDRTNASLEE